MDLSETNWIWTMSFFLLIVFALGGSLGDESIIQSEFKTQLLSSLREECPKIVPRMFHNKVPRGRMGDNKTMTYKRFRVTSFEDCYKGCCGDDRCNMAFMFVNESKINCYKVTCLKDELCLPMSPDSEKDARSMNKTHMVLVRPSNHESWSSLTTSKAIKSNSSVDLKQNKTNCEVGLELEQCQLNEICQPLNEKSRNGFCQCAEGLNRNATTGLCQAMNTEDNENNYDDASGETSTSTTMKYSTTLKAPIKITVSLVSKEIILPVNTATLTAYGFPEAPKTSPYSYEWSLISMTKTGGGGTQSSEPSTKMSGNMMKSNEAQLELSDLVQGVYQFKVRVFGSDPPAYGEAIANVTVLPEKRINKPPVARLHPEDQKIKLPTVRAIVDASDSTDDAPKDDLTFKWELVSNPLGYQQTLKNGPILTLDNLVAGDYTVKVTVVDQEGASDSAEATILVEEENDYPPIANAGEDVIIYLPQNEVTLHGNQSSDDHKIESWEWTRKSGQSGQKELAADAYQMRTPFPVISNLEQGTYTFILKVTDVKGQSAEDEVNIYVKPAINLPPTANAGETIEISLPDTSVTLDGSKSKDDVKILGFSWEQVSGPKKANIESPDAEITNVTLLTKGTYTFKLTVVDNLENKDEATVKVIVNQDANEEPIANAGDDIQVVEPISSVLVNGSKSSDDFRIARWLWTRQAGSLAAGKVVEESDHTSTLILTDLVAGKYAFQLQIWDDQGKTSTDSVSIDVKKNPNEMNVIQAIFSEELSLLTQDKLDSIVQRIELLLPQGGKYKVQVLDLFPQLDSGRAIMHFMVWKTEQLINGGSSKSDSLSSSESLEKNTKVASGKKVVDELNEKLKADFELLPVKVLSLDTLVCQNTCSGHGTCHQASRRCVCEPFWVENFVRRQFPDGKSNCEWSIIYVGIFLATIATILVCGLCYFSFKKKRRGVNKVTNRSGGNRSTRYSRLDQSEPGIELRNAYTSSLMISESDTDEEILYENSNESDTRVVRNGIGGTDLQRRNGQNKTTSNA